MTTTGTLILAAGRSSRMGRPKALLPFRNSTFLEYLVGLYSRFGPVWVAVSPALAKEVSLLGIPAPVLVMERWEPGLFATVRPSVARLAGRVGQLLVTPVDCLLPDATVPAALLAVAARVPEPPVLVPTHDGLPGHPVLLRGAALENVARQPETARFDAVLAAIGTLDVPCEEPWIRLNINREADYTQLLDADARRREQA